MGESKCCTVRPIFNCQEPGTVGFLETLQADAVSYLYHEGLLCIITETLEYEQTIREVVCS